MLTTLFGLDVAYTDSGAKVLCGVDEAGRGPLAGPVFAAAVILSARHGLEGLNDSKKLTVRKREALYDIIKANSVYHIAFASHEEIDEYNILGASMLAMARAAEGLNLTPDLILVDGHIAPQWPYHTISLVKGDEKSACIAAASILAKVERDRYMLALDNEYPGYGFAKHKGYPTKLHYERLDALGPSPVHRESFLRKWRGKRGTMGRC